VKPRPFQQEAIDKFSQPQIVSRLLGDDMGLGKTVTAICLDLENRRQEAEKGRRQSSMMTLIVAPLAVTESWVRHVNLLAPQARVVVCDPKRRGDFLHELKKPPSRRAHYFIVHYEAMRLMVSELKKYTWFHIIADECHRIKNRKAQVTNALKALTAEKKTGCSGTPADDRPMDLWSVLNWLWPTVYRSYWKFDKHYCVYETETNWGTGGAFRKFAGVQNAQSLHKEMEPWFIRRLKEDVIKDLPDKIYTDVWVDLDPKQRRAYNQMRDDMITWIEQQDKLVPLPAAVVVAQLTRLQQFALGYMETYTVERHVKEKHIPERHRIDKVTGEPYVIPAKVIKAHIVKEDKWRISDPSAKIDALMSILEDNPNQQVVVFSQFKSVLHLLGKRLEKAKIPHGLYTGDQNKQERDKLIDDFQAGKVRVFAGSIAAGGEGITLTAASIVVFLDRSWKPSKNRQAEDRLHRIGQKNAVQVIDIMARNTVDLGRRQRLIQKWQWIREILGDSKKVQKEAESWTIQA